LLWPFAVSMGVGRLWGPKASRAAAVDLIGMRDMRCGLLRAPIGELRGEVLLVES